MRIASATRSTRSTTMTASAVSEETVAPRAHRDADVCQGQRRRVVDAVADHHHATLAGQLACLAHDVDLLLGRASAKTRSTPTDLPTASPTARSSPVTSATCSIPTVRRLAVSSSASSAQPVRHQDRPGEVAVDPNQHPGQPSAPLVIEHLRSALHSRVSRGGAASRCSRPQRDARPPAPRFPGRAPPRPSRERRARFRAASAP